MIEDLILIRGCEDINVDKNQDDEAPCGNDASWEYNSEDLQLKYRESNSDGVQYKTYNEYVNGMLHPIYVALIDLILRLDHHKVDLDLFD